MLKVTSNVCSCMRFMSCLPTQVHSSLNFGSKHWRFLMPPSFSSDWCLLKAKETIWFGDEGSLRIYKQTSVEDCTPDGGADLYVICMCNHQVTAVILLLAAPCQCPAAKKGHTYAHTFEYCQSVIAYALLRTEYIILASYLMQTYSKAVTEKKKEASNYSAYWGHWQQLLGG